MRGGAFLRGEAWPSEGWRPTARGGIFAWGGILPPGVMAFCVGGVFLFQGNFRGNFAWGGILDGDVLRGGAFFSREISAVTLRGPPRLRELLQY